MSDTLLSGRWVVTYEAENREKSITRDTSVTPTVIDTVNTLYSALQDLFDELGQMDDGIPMSAQTPTEYTVGIIDAGDKDPWFIDRQSAEYLRGGAIKTADWLRVVDSKVGIVKVACTNTNIVAGDIGFDIVHDAADVGTLLDVKGTGANSVLWIRPDSFVAANNFDSVSGSLTCNTHVAAQTAAASSGESLWANIYSLGTIETYTQLYVYQGGSYLNAYKGTASWWNDGHIDILVNVKEVGNEVDEAVVKVAGRQFSKTYDYYEVDLSAGGRNPIPLATGADLNNTTGFRRFTWTAGAGTFAEDERIYKTGTDKEGIVTNVNTTASQLTYYLIGNPITDFVNTDTVKGVTSSASCTAGAPSNVGPAAMTGASIAHGADETFDIDENGTTENYSVVIDTGGNSLANVYEWAKYITRRGDANTGNTDGEKGEQYIGSDWRILYAASTGTVSEGNVVTQVSTCATGTVVAHNTTDNILVLRTSRFTFDGTNDIRKDGSNYVTGPSPTAIAPVKACPYGSFAGGKFFCAPGVVLKNVSSSDANNYQLTDDNGTVVVAPTKVTVSVGNSKAGDKIAVFRLATTGGSILKNEYDATVQSIGATSLITGASIVTDTVGKSTGGVVKLVDTSASQEYRIRYGSWSGLTFTLAASTGLTADATTDSGSIVDSGAFVGAKIGDIIRCIGAGSATYITSIPNNNTAKISPTVAGLVSTCAYEMNTLPVATTTADDVYVPFIDVYETTGSPASGSPGSESVSVTFVSTVPVRIRARQAGDILPYEADSTITSTGMSMNIIRSPDTIYSV